MNKVETKEKGGKSEKKDNPDFQVTVIELSRIVPDKEQPRKSFAVDRMRDLRESIKTHGLINPLTVQKRKEGGYLLLDGERRFRALTELGMKEVPVVIINELTPIERLIKQFHIQEQHEGWTFIEKAKAVKKLSEALGLDISKVSRMLGLTEANAKHMLAFSRLVEPQKFERSNAPMRSIEYISMLKASAKKAYDVLEKDFDRDVERSLEHELLARISNGELRQSSDFSKIGDTFRADPKAVDKFLKGRKSKELYHETHADDRTALRQFRWQAAFITMILRRPNRGRLVKIVQNNAELKSVVNSAARELASFAKDVA